MALRSDRFGQAVVDCEAAGGPLICYVDQLGSDFRTSYIAPFVFAAGICLIYDFRIVADPFERVV